MKSHAKIPTALNSLECGADTLRGRYGPSEIWIRNNDRMTVDVDVLADTVGRKWIPNLSAFFKDNLIIWMHKVPPKVNIDLNIVKMLPVIIVSVW